MFLDWSLITIKYFIYFNVKMGKKKIKEIIKEKEKKKKK